MGLAHEEMIGLKRAPKVLAFQPDQALAWDFNCLTPDMLGGVSVSAICLHLQGHTGPLGVCVSWQWQVFVTRTVSISILL